MGIQKEILTRKITTDVKVAVGEQTLTLAGDVGTLALGKLGDVIATAYGPVTKAVTLTADAEFGDFVEGAGIVTNSDDIAGVGTVGSMFDTKKAHKGQTVSMLVSGGVIIKGANLETLKTKMNVIGTIDLYDGTVDPNNAVIGVIVNGLIPAPAAA